MAIVRTLGLRDCLLIRMVWTTDVETAYQVQLSGPLTVENVYTLELFAHLI